MKPFLGIDLTNDKHNTQPNGAEFLIRQPSPVLAQALESSNDQADQTLQSAKLPLIVRIFQGICGLAAAMMAVGLLRAMTGTDAVTIGQAYDNAPWVFWVGFGGLLIWGVLQLIASRKEKAVLNSDENEQMFEDLAELQNRVLDDLGVPQNAPEVDLLSFYYKEKGDGFKVCEKGLQLASYLNPVFHLFRDEENLYVGNLEGKYAFPRASLRGIRTVKKTIRIAGWNKDADLDSGMYAPYKLYADKYGCVICKRYHILEVERNGAVWGIYFPDYELPFFEAATGMKAEE